MILECEKTKLEPIIQKATRLANKHLTLPVLSCLYLEAKDNNLTIKSTNLDIGLEVDVKVKTIEKGVLAVPASVLMGVLSSIKDENLHFESKDNNLKISSGKSSLVIKCLPYDDFPSIPKFKESKTVKINSEDLIDGFKSVWYSASNSNIKPELSSVFVFKNDGNLFFVSTDSFRLAEKKINIKNDYDFPQILIPSKNISEIIKILDDFSGPIDMIFEKNQTAFVGPDFYLVSRLIDGSFPDYKQIIPKDFKTTVTILKNDLINSIKTSNIFSDTLNQVKLKVNIKDKKLEIESKNNDVGEFNEKINAAVSGDDTELNFNSRFLIDCVQSVLSDSLILNFGGAGKPLVISGSSDPTFLYMVMPMNR